MDAWTPTVPSPAPRWMAIATIVVAVALLVAGHVAWSMATPAPGERRFVPARAGAAQAAAIAAAAAAHAVLLGIALPLLYRRRPAYAALGIAGGVTAALAGVAAAALFASTR